MIFLADENSVRHNHRYLAAIDLTHLLMDEVLPVAKAVGIEDHYRKLSKSGKTDYTQIEKWLKMLYGKPENWIAEIMNKAEPFAGSRETIEYLKKAGYETVIVTDDALMNLPECNRTIKEKTGADKIIPTAEIEHHGGKICGGLRNIRTKPQILGDVLKQYNPSKLLCMVQGLNDYKMAASARETGGTIISVNSHSPDLERVSHYHIASIAEAPELLSRILVK